MTRVKICGLSDTAHVLAAGEAGADFLGFVFAPSFRQISPERAAQLVEATHSLKQCPATVGVFVNKESSKVNRIGEQCHLDWVQLSGNENYQYCREIKHHIIKTIHIPAGKKAVEILNEVKTGYQAYNRKKFRCLLDSQISGAYGGTGKVFNWQLAREIAHMFPVIIAGGLTPENVGQLIMEIRPWGVDVSSGVETNGKKDTKKIKAFIEAVRKIDS